MFHVEHLKKFIYKQKMFHVEHFKVEAKISKNLLFGA